MATLPIKPLDGADGYLRWKESVLLHLHSVDVAHVLSDEPPSPARASVQAVKKWARDDALCRGHILAALSDHLLPVYVRHDTGRALWQAVARTYEPGASSWELMFEELEFGEDETLLERVARAEALAIAAFPKGSTMVARMVRTKLPPGVGRDAILEGGESSMAEIWRSAQHMQALRNLIDINHARVEKDRSSAGKSGHIAKKRRWCDGTDDL